MQEDFDFMFGRWLVRHRRLRLRLVNDTQWDEFDGVSTTQPVLGGLGNIEDNRIDFPGEPYRAVALRSFDAASDSWAIWWLDQRMPHIVGTPVVGRFVGNVGTFFANDIFEGRPVKVRFIWRRDKTPVWEQAFSADGGASWETNWTMSFQRAA